MLSDELYETHRTMFEHHGHARDLLAQLDQLGLAALQADARYGQRGSRGPTTPTKPVDKPAVKTSLTRGQLRQPAAFPQPTPLREDLTPIS